MFYLFEQEVDTNNPSVQYTQYAHYNSDWVHTKTANGTPTIPGTYTFVITATKGTNPDATQNGTIPTGSTSLQARFLSGSAVNAYWDDFQITKN